MFTFPTLAECLSRGKLKPLYQEARGTPHPPYWSEADKGLLTPEGKPDFNDTFKRAVVEQKPGLLAWW